MLTADELKAIKQTYIDGTPFSIIPSYREVLPKLLDHIEGLQKENDRLKYICKGYKFFGTDGCKSCENGRITIFNWNDSCITCDPESYKDFTEKNKQKEGN